MVTLSTNNIAAQCGIYAPLSVKNDILAYGEIHTNSLREHLTWLQTRCVEGMKYCDSSRLEVFDIHFVVLTNHADAPTSNSGPADPDTGIIYAGTDFFRQEIRILNQRFVDEDGSQVCENGYCVRFRYKSHQFLNDIQSSGEALLEYGDQTDATTLSNSKYYGQDFADAVWACNDRRFVDPFAINVFIYNASKVDGSGAVVNARDCHGRSNGRRDSEGDKIFRPYILFEVSRLLHVLQSPEEHEMGHVLGLGHNCDPNVAGGNSDSNIMQSGRKDSCLNYASGSAYSGGLRNQGFGAIQYEQALVKNAVTAGNTYVPTPYEQITAIITRAKEIQAGWCKLAQSN